MRRLLLPIAVALPILVPGSVAAQAPAQRTALERLRDSLAGVRDSASLKRLEATLIGVAKRHRDDPVIHLQLGFLAYRLGEITARNRHYDDAAGEFEWAGELAPDWPYPWYGLGLAELAQGESPVIAVENIKEQLGKDYLTKAARAFARAVQADPGFAQATIDLAHTALAQRIQPQLDVALRAVRLAAASPAGRDSGVQLARGRLEREVGDVDSALAGFQAYIAAGGDSGLGLLELARTYYLAQRPADGWRAYFAGARVARSPEAVGLYRADLSVVAGPEEATPFEGLTSPAARAAWLEHFWLRRDVAEARNPGERLAEHYRRWFYVWRTFRLVSRHRHYDITERYRSDQAEFDDRGIIYLRHGPPDQRASYPRVVDRLEPNETWLYHRPPPDGDLIFHFVARGDVQDFKLVESLADALTAGQGGALALQSRRGLDPLTGELFASRAAISPVYARLGNTVGSANATGALSAERALGRRSIAVGTTTDSYARAFDAPLGTIASDFVVGDSAGQALHVVFAIPARRLDAIPDTGRVVYPLAFRLFVSDTGDALVARLDTTRAFTARAPLPDGSYLTGQVRLTIPPGRYRYRLLVRELGASAGDLVTGDSIVAQRLDGRDFAASDLVLGRRGSGLVWVTPRDTVPLNPLAEFAAGGTATLYYEVYGLAAGASYHTVIRLERAGRRSFFHRLFGGKSAPVLLEFDAAADGPVTRVHRDLELHDAPKGAYVLTVAIRDPASGVTLTRRCRFVVVSRQSG
jgi:GWxTD domain-containing protein